MPGSTAQHPRRVRAALALVVTLTVLTLLGAGLAAPAGSEAAGRTAAQAERPPDVIVIMTDDQRVGTEKGMPCLRDELRPQMTYYPNAQVPNNNCCPSRWTFLSGRYSHSTGVWDNTRGEPDG